MSEVKFNNIRARYTVAGHRLTEFESTMRRKYGQSRPPLAWMTKGEADRLSGIQKAQSKEADKFFALLDDISPRNWRSKVAYWWVMERLTYADAITTDALSVIPQAGYGTTHRESERFSAPAA